MIGSVLDKAAKLIHGEEGERLTVYKDTGGAWTIGRGHLVRPGERFYPYGGSKTVTGQGVRTITPAESLALFEQDLAEARSGVAKVKVPLNANETAALLSLVFNIGVAAFSASTLLKKLNAGDRVAAAAEFPRWRFDNGVEVPALLARRNREMKLFTTAV